MEYRESLDLVEFQKKISKKIESCSKRDKNTGIKWLGFRIEENYYAVNLSRVKEVLSAPERYINLGGWFHKGILGGMQHRDEVWVVFNGVKCLVERGHKNAQDIDFRLLLLRQNEMNGNLSIAVDKIFGLMELEGLEKSSATTQNRDKDEFGVEDALISSHNNTWRIWDPLIWRDSVWIKNVDVIKSRLNKNKI